MRGDAGMKNFNSSQTRIEFPDSFALSFDFADLYKGAGARFYRMQTSDIAALINRVAIGDRAAFVSLYRATNPKFVRHQRP